MSAAPDFALRWALSCGEEPFSVWHRGRTSGAERLDVGTHGRGRQFRLLVSTIVTVIAVGGCSSGAPQSASGSVPSHPATPHDPLPSRHVHGVARDPGDGRVYLATHDGLFHIAGGGEATRVGPVIDLMGFAVAGPGHFYASGHPGPGVNLPDPVGLIESRDAGQTWTALSRQGESDFHALAFSRGGVVGFDGEQLAATRDGQTWRQLTAPVAPHAVAVSPDGTVVLVTSVSGLARSADQGVTWRQVQSPLPLQLVTWVDAKQAVGVAPDGRIAVSTDAAVSWQVRGSIGAAPHALGAHSISSGGFEILAVTGAGLLRSADSGVSFAAYAG
jgi:photosystem II stability/assembly factor-like uncharacterized protein